MNGNGNGKPRNQRIMQGSVLTKANAPLQNLPAFKRSGQNGQSHLTGRDFVQKLTVKAKADIVTASDRILLRQPISASSFAGTRLSALSQLWERYRWTQAVMEYVPAVPNTLAAQLIAYIDTDPNDDPNVVVDADELLRQAVAQAGSRQWNFNTRMDVPLIIRKDDQLYYTGEDKQNPRFSQQGVLYILQVTDLINFNGELIASSLESGAIYIRWGCMFSMQQINPSFSYPSPPPATAELVKVGEYGFLNTTTVTVTGLEPEKQYVVVPQKMQLGTSEPVPTGASALALLTVDAVGYPTVQIASANLDTTYTSGSTGDLITEGGIDTNVDVVIRAGTDGVLTATRSETISTITFALYTYEINTSV